MENSQLVTILRQPSISSNKKGQKKLKILLCLHHFLPEFVGGTEIYTLRLAQQIKQNGIEPVILIPHFDHSTTSEYAYEGVRVIRYAETSIENDRKMIMGKKEPLGLVEFVKVVKAEQPNIIHFHELSPGRGLNIFHVEKAYELKIPIVLTFHLSYYTCMKGSLVYKDEKKCDGIIRINACTECIYQSKNITGIKAKLLVNTALALFNTGINPTKLNSTLGTALGFPFVVNKIKENLIRFSNLAEKIIVLADWYKEILIKNEVPATKLLYIKQGLTTNTQLSLNYNKISYPFKVVYIGRISKLKGLHLLIDAVCQLPEEKISLFIYGPETEEGYANDCKQKSIHKKNIYWKGTIPSEDVIPALSNYHVLCLPSAFEMSPLVIQEAFAAGLPVLASDVYGNAEQINDGINGWLFRFNDSNDLANKLIFLTNDLSIVEKAQQNLPASNEFKQVAEKHMALYSEIISYQNQLS
jgi:glycosyltransferase involved in cell wall biosynthesis